MNEVHSRMLCTVFATFLYISAYSESHGAGCSVCSRGCGDGFFLVKSRLSWPLPVTTRRSCGGRPVQRQGVFQRSKILYSVLWWKKPGSGVREVRRHSLSLSPALCSVTRNCSGRSSFPLQNEAMSDSLARDIVRM